MSRRETEFLEVLEEVVKEDEHEVTIGWLGDRLVMIHKCLWNHTKRVNASGVEPYDIGELFDIEVIAKYFIPSLCP